MGREEENFGKEDGMEVWKGKEPLPVAPEEGLRLERGVMVEGGGGPGRARGGNERGEDVEGLLLLLPLARGS